MFDSQRYDIIKDAIMDSKYGFSMDTLFALTKGKKRERAAKAERAAGPAARRRAGAPLAP